MTPFAPRPARRWRTHIFALAAIVLLGAVLRLGELSRLPPGLYQDEGVEGFDALRILRGEFPIYFETNYGREPGFMYVLALGIALLGRTPLALRAVSAVAGTLAIPIGYAAVKELFDRKTALVAAFVLAVTFWPIALSRLGLRSSLLPAALGLGVWALTRAWRVNRTRDWLLAGLLLGLSLYTYLPARLALIPLVAMALIGWFSGLDWQKLLRGGAAFALAYGLAALPLAVYAVAHWEVFNGRAAQVSILNPDINNGRLLETLLGQGLAAARMFLIEGDDNLRHNVPGRPVFDWLMGAAFVVGLAAGLRRWRERRWQFTAIWLGVFILPTILTDSAPHSLRAYGVWPLLAVLPAVGLRAVYGWMRRRAGALAATLLAAAVLLGSLFATVRDYFWSGYLTGTDAYYAFDGFAADLAAEANRFTGAGWQGAGPPETVRGEVWIDPRLYHFTKTVEFLIPQTPSDAGPVHLIVPGAVPAAGNVRLLVVPGEEGASLGLLPPDSLISIRDGALARAKAADTPFLLYRSITAQPAVGLPAPVACFENGLVLLAPALNVADGTLSVELLWRLQAGSAPGDTVFVHAYQDGVLVGQSDSFPAGGQFPFSWLRPGDVVRDNRSVPLEGGAFNQVGVGVYDAATGQRRVASDCAGQPLGDEVFIH
jgi:4-amino-4-deoxy-L-arabinose transferase-like glycosyltransferase